ncbi:MAG: OmpH family outer membrane protein [Calditrichota bacterium]
MNGLMFQTIRLILVFPFIALTLSSCAPTSRGRTSGEDGAKTGPTLPWASSGVKIGYVRSDEIMKKYPEYADAERSLRADNSKWQSEADRMQSDVQKMENEREELKLILSEERRKQLDDDISRKRQDLQKFRQDTWYSDNSSYVKRRRELIDPIDARVNDAIWKVAEAKGLDVVFDAMAGNIVYVKPGLDITALVLEELER